MPPKVKITKEQILATALETAKREGVQAINARSLAASLGCSTQPIFSNFANMETLHLALVQEAEKVCMAYMQQEMARGEYPSYKACGMAYIRFAREEKELFKLLYMCDRQGQPVEKGSVQDRTLVDLVHGNTGLEGETLDRFLLEMWAYVHGIATMSASGYWDIPWALVSQMLTDAYLGLKKQYALEE